MGLRVRRWQLVLALLVLVQAGFVALYIAFDDSARSVVARTTPLSVGDRAPPIRVTRENGSQITLGAEGAGPVLLHFWATWCEPCRKELPALLAFAESRTAGMSVVAISVDQDWAAVRAFFDGPIPKQVVRANAANALATYGGSKLPDTYLVASDGRLIARFEGTHDWASPTFRSELGRLANGK